MRVILSTIEYHYIGYFDGAARAHEMAPDIYAGVYGIWHDAGAG